MMSCTLHFMLALIGFCNLSSHKVQAHHTKYHYDEDFLLGGLFPIHITGDNPNKYCGGGELLEDKGIQRLEAMIFAVDQINDYKDYWKISLGLKLLDTCSSVSHALEQSLQFLRLTDAAKCSMMFGDIFGIDWSERVTAVIGASNSPVSEAVARILRPFKIPQVSYASTSEELDDLDNFPYFFRVVPSDKFQIQVMLDILAHFDWNYISAVTAKGDYGEKAIQHLKELQEVHKDVCFATTEIMDRSPKKGDYKKVIERLLEYPDARVVIVFLNEDKLRLLIEAAESILSKNRRGHFVWLGSDSWGAKMNVVSTHKEAVDGAITVLPTRSPVKEFDEYFKKLNPYDNSATRNPWFHDYWEKKYRCKLPVNPVAVEDSVRKSTTARKLCTELDEYIKYFNSTSRNPWYDDYYRNKYGCRFPNEAESLVEDSKGTGEPPQKMCTGLEANELKHTRPHVQEGLVPKVMDAVLVVAHALRNMCKERGICDKNNKFFKGSTLLQYMQNVTFEGSSGDSLSFDSNRSIPVGYDIFQFTVEKNYVPIGKWDIKNRLQLKHHPEWTIHHKSGRKDRIGNIKSGCGDICWPGWQRIRTSGCCWVCQACDRESYLADAWTCKQCPENEVPTSNKSTCERLEPFYMGRDWNNPWTFLPLTISILGIIFTCFCAAVFVKFRKTALMKAMGRELCYVKFAGIMLCYLFTFIVAAQPSTASCGFHRMGLGLGLAICYSAILTKTNRISRIFNRRRVTKRPVYMSPESQIVICGCLVSIQVTLSVMWLIIRPPKVSPHTMEKPRELLHACDMDNTSVMLGLLYNMLLVIMCTVYAFKTRNIPSNFNEAKYISFAMYSNCIIWLAFLASTYSDFGMEYTWKDYRVQTSVLCICVSMCGTAILLCLFCPKLYIALFQPDKNVRYPTSATNSGSAVEISSSAIRYAKPQSNQMYSASAGSSTDNRNGQEKNKVLL